MTENPILAAIGCCILVFSSPASAKPLRFNTAKAPHLAVFYPSPNYEGTPIYLDRVGTWKRGDAGFAEIAADTAGSIRIAPGYRARLTVEKTDMEMIKPEDDADLSDDRISSINELVIEAAPAIGPRPRIFFAPTGNNKLVDSAHDEEWGYVRRHVDGIWFNCAGISWPDIHTLLGKISNRVIVNEQGSHADSFDDIKPLDSAGPNTLLRRYPDFKCAFEGTSLFKGYHEGDAVPKWNAGDVQWARSRYSEAIPASPARSFPKIYTGWQPWPFLPQPHDSGHALLAGTAAETEFNAGDGAFMECGPKLFKASRGFRASVFNIVTRLHAQGKPFFWFMPHRGGEDAPDPEFIQAVKNAYYVMEAHNMIASNDAYYIVNYDGSLKVLPERDSTDSKTPPTMTGIMYWLLHQGVSDNDPVLLRTGSVGARRLSEPESHAYSILGRRLPAPSDIGGSSSIGIKKPWIIKGQGQR